MSQIGQISPARNAAFNILRRVETEQSYAANLLAAEDDKLSPVDRRLTYELVLGVLRWQLQLDYLIEKLCGRSIQKLDLGVVIALRLGLYQIRFLTRIPSSAAVNESVEIVKRSGFKSAAGFVNALLRRAIKESSQILAGASSASVTLSHPEWLIEKWSRDFGADEAKKLALANNQPPATVFRVNPLNGSKDQTITEISRRGIEIAPGALVSTAIHLRQGSASDLKDLAASGAIYFQDEASQFVAHLVSAKPGEKILDLCAAPGSKTTLLAADMNNEGLIIAVDLHHQRLVTLMRICKTLGVRIVEPIALDASGQVPLKEDMKFDAVLVDAPCSGTGTLRHNPEIKLRLELDQIEELGALQSKILKNVAQQVVTGGRLIYSTCSLEREEDEKVVLEFLKSHPEFEPVRLNNVTATAEGFYRTFPQVHGCDGFFAAVLRKTSAPGR